MSRFMWSVDDLEFEKERASSIDRMMWDVDDLDQQFNPVTGKPGKGPKMIRADSVSPKKVDKANPNHRPAGDERGGEFMSGVSGGDEEEEDPAYGEEDPAEITTTRKLTPSERAELLGYQGSNGSFSEINRYLRESGDSAALDKKIQLIDAAMSKSSTLENMVVYRGSQSWDRHSWMTRLDSETEFTMPAYMSTTTEQDWAGEFSGTKGTLFEIEVPKGSKAIYLNNALGVNSKTPSERELLLPRNSRFKIQAVDEKSKTVRLRLIDEN